VVTHGLVCRALGQQHFALPANEVPTPRGFGNTSLTIVDPKPPHAVLLLNCCAHLEGQLAGPGGISGI
jgi:broad specificity phosphatase PhoE